MKAKDFLKGYNFWMLPKGLILKIGLEQTYMLIVLIEADNLMADKDGWFFQTHDTIEEVSGLSRRKQDNAIKELKKLGLIEQKNVGVPQKRHFRVDNNNLTKLFESIENANCVRNEQSTLLETANNKESIYKESIKDTMADAKQQDGFIKVIDFYNEKNLPKYTKITDKRKSMVNARIKEYSVDTVLNGLDMASKSEFLNKSENKSWYNFDWIFNPNNFVKILEGKYNKAEPKAKTETQEFLERLKKGGKK